MSSVSHCLVKKVGRTKVSNMQSGDWSSWPRMETTFFQGCNDKAIRKITRHLFGDPSIRVVLMSGMPSFHLGELGRNPVRSWEGIAGVSETKTLV